MFIFVSYLLDLEGRRVPNWILLHIGHDKTLFHQIFIQHKIFSLLISILSLKIKNYLNRRNSDVFALVAYQKEDESYRLIVFSEESVPLFGPSLPCPASFRSREEFREFPIVKCKYTAFNFYYCLPEKSKIIVFFEFSEWKIFIVRVFHCNL